MSTIYSVIPGDDFSLIARKVYGDDANSSLIIRANPGVVEPLSPGTVLTIPQDTVINNTQTIPADSSEEISILVDGLRFRFWESITIHESMDRVSTFSMVVPFDPSIPELRTSFQPFSFKQISVFVSGQIFFRGYMVAIQPSLSALRQVVTVGGYALTGVLGDCTASPAEYSVEFNSQFFNEIADAIIRPFGLSTELLEDVGAVFERVAIKPEQKVLPFLIDLAQQRNLLLSSNANGQLRISREIEGGIPSAILNQGDSNVISVSPSFESQLYYSHITGLEPVSVGADGSSYTVNNPRLNGAFRPFVFTVKDTGAADLKDAVDVKAGHMFANIASFDVKVPTWFDPNGTLWRPNSLLKLTAPGAMIYNDYTFLIRDVKFDRINSGSSATLTLVLPGSFRGVIPERFPWEE